MSSKSFFQVLAAVLLAGMSVVSCSKDSVDPIDPSVSIEFENRVGDQKLVLNTPAYKNAAGESFAVTKLNYFVSNLSLTKQDGTIQTFPDGYFLVRQTDTKSQIITLQDVPSGDYTQMSFVLGVDSLKSVAPPAQRVGALDVMSYGDDGMYWAWNSGYIFMKLEGTSTVIPTSVNANGAFAIHVGGFGGGWNGSARTANNLRTVTVPMTTPATVRGNVAPVIHLFVDALKIFDGPNKISLAKTSAIHSPAVAGPVADNCKTMFQVDHVHNEKR